MVREDPVAQEYRTAYARWLEDLTRLHAVLLDGESLDPLRRVALIRRESHSKDRYEAARAKLLGLPDESDAGGGGSSLFNDD